MTAVGVNLLWCVPGQVGGSEEYLTRSLAGLAEQAPDLELLLFVLPGFARAHPDLAAAHEVLEAPVSGRWRSWRVAAEWTWLARGARQRQVALLHHGGGTAPRGPEVPVVLTVHDVQYLVFPQHFSPLKRAWLRRTVPTGLRRASVVATPSAFVKGTLVDAFGVDPDRIAVVPHGVPAGSATPSAEGDEALRTRYGLRGPFVIYPAATYPHKNHGLLLDALCLLPSADVKLVLIGGVGRGEAALQDAIGSRGLADRVVRPGRVPDADRDRLLQLADALVFPSRYEGFGAPVIEAFALGTPVIAAATTALPEVVGEAGLVLDPDDAPAWAAAIESVGTDAELRARLIAAGQARAREFSAARSTAALAAVYRRALAEATLAP